MRRHAALVCLALILPALAAGSHVAGDSATPEPLAAINPLTGRPAPEPAFLLLNPVIAKVSNAPAGVRPQAGLQAADLVFEHYTEAGLTRFSAVFHGQRPQRVGSIRSARLIDLELLPMLQGLLAWSGASNGVLERLNAGAQPERLFTDRLYRWPWYWREPAIPAPHNLFVNAAALGELALRAGAASLPDLRGLTFREEAPDDAAGPAPLIDFRYLATQVRWDYDAGTGRYRRFAEGEPHYDASSGQQLQASNVIALYADHRLTDIVESVWQGVTYYSIDIDLSSGGEALLFRDGQYHAARWQRPAPGAMLQFSDRADAPLSLKPGNTWLQIMPPPAQQGNAEGVTIHGATS